jgi:ABC-2 type transport system permease protein
LEDGNRSIVLNLSDFPKSLKVERNVGDANSQTAVSILNQILDKATISQAHIPDLIALNVEDVNVHNLKYIDFLLPGLVAMAVMQLSVFSVAFVFVEYKERGILKRVLATPIRPYQFVIANIITRLIIAVIQALFFIVVGVLLFKVTIVGSFFLIIPIVILGAIMFLGLGFTISGLSKTTESVPAFANLIVFPMLFLSGVFFPLENMPVWLRYISKILPLTYFSEALRNVMTKGAGVADIYPDLIVIVIWAIILVALAVLTFRFEEKRA